MEDKEALEFFNKVKGCKIRHTSWSTLEYFIPEFYFPNKMTGTFYFNDHISTSTEVDIYGDGFKEDEYGHK